MPRKILASDYDQTFFIDETSLELNKIDVHQFRKRGDFFVFATGRSFPALNDEVQRFHLEYDFAIINHGATIIDQNQTIIQNVTINKEITSALIQDLTTRFSVEISYYKQLSQKSSIFCEHPTKIKLYFQTPADAYSAFLFLQHKYHKQLLLHYFQEKYIEITSGQSNKAKALALLANRLKIPSEDIFTVGDYYNDLEMIRSFTGFAIRTSIPEIKQIAVKKYQNVSNLIEELIENDAKL